MKQVVVHRLRRSSLFKELRRFAPAITIDEVNWPETFPACPVARARIGYHGEHLLLVFDVDEQQFRANEHADNGRVWEDSCVEFFIQPEADGGYYNLECNAIGTLLLAHGNDRREREQAPPEVLDSIMRQATLEVRRLGNSAWYHWSLSLAIPFSAFFRHRFAPGPDRTMRGNFYKCGDRLPVPHFLSWNPVDAASPDFHRPECFGLLSFQP
ncbi:MAG: hypothetical protein LBG30_07905 [Odoribacteraceae bacterium]|jgi:hypothetical protein|nr:hypothetical protein [Odoribacteraceae bacterium]